MSDDEDRPRGGGGGPSGLTEEDVGLPKATVSKVIGEMLPDDIACAKEVKDLIADCCKEFVTLISTEANEICEKEAKKTISPEHIVSALKNLGFESYVEEVQSVHAEHKTQQKQEKQKKSKKADSGMSEADMLAMQERLFADSKARMDAGHM